MSSQEFAFRPGRIEIDVPVAVEIGEVTSAATLLNIGRGGLFVATETTFRVGDRIALTFTLPDEERSIFLRAEVRWIRVAQGRPSGLGLRFVDLSVEAAIAILEFLRKSDADLTPSWPST